VHVVQAGKGAVRPLVVAYHAGGGLAGSVSRGTAILSYTAPGFERHYDHFSADSPNLDTIATDFGARLDAEAFWPIVLAGFSEGCQGIRTQLLAGFAPSAILAIDGTHSSLPPLAWQLDVWRGWFERCGAQLDEPPADDCEAVEAAPIAVVTFSQIQTKHAKNPYTSTRDTMEAVTGWALPPGPSSADPAVSCSGNVWLYSFPGADAETHIDQGTRVLPEALRGLATSLGFGPGGAPPLPPSAPPAPPRAPGGGGASPLAPSGGGRVAAAAALGAALYLMVRRNRDEDLSI
jgi:hypothetical protein